MVLVPSSIIDDWQSKVDQLNTDLGSTCRLVFETGLTSTANVISDPIGNKPRVGLPFGGRGDAFNLPGRNSTDNTAESGEGLQYSEGIKDIIARVYHAAPRDLERFGISITDNTNVYEMLTQKRYIPDLRRCKWAFLFYNLGEKETRATLIRSPAPYGLGQPYQCRSFWKEV